jgi:hypothetical protein
MNTSASINISADEGARIAAVRRYEILDTQGDGGSRERALDATVEMVGGRFELPLVDGFPRAHGA